MMSSVLVIMMKMAMDCLDKGLGEFANWLLQ